MIIRLFSGLVFGAVSLVLQLAIVAIVIIGGYALITNHSEELSSIKDNFLESEIITYASEIFSSVEVDKMPKLLENVTQFEIQDALSRTGNIEALPNIDSKDTEILSQ